MALVMVPASLIAYPLTKVVYGAFARLRDTPERVAKLWLKAITMLAAVVLPTLFGLIALAPDLIPLAFGDQWTGAVPHHPAADDFHDGPGTSDLQQPGHGRGGKPQIGTFLNATVLVALPPAILIGNSLGGIEGIAVGFNLAVVIAGESPSFFVTTRELSLSRACAPEARRRSRSAPPSRASRPFWSARFSRTRDVEPSCAFCLSLLVLGGAYCLALALFARGTALLSCFGCARRSDRPSGPSADPRLAAFLDAASCRGTARPRSVPSRARQAGGSRACLGARAWPARHGGRRRCSSAWIGGSARPACASARRSAPAAALSGSGSPAPLRNLRRFSYRISGSARDVRSPLGVNQPYEDDDASSCARQDRKRSIDVGHVPVEGDPHHEEEVVDVPVRPPACLRRGREPLCGTAPRRGTRSIRSSGCAR